MANPDLDQDALARLRKPLKGEYTLQRKATVRERKAAEAAIMRQAKKRDEFKCRWPGCTLDLPCDPCHEKHRGMGGNPDGSRTTLATLITLCRQHHDMWDKGVIDIRPQHAGIGFNFCADFYVLSESGSFELYRRERLIGVSVAVGL